MKIVLATGGTGGHIFPALALMEELLKAGAEVEFIVDKRFFNYYEKVKHNFPNVPIHQIAASSISGNIAQKLKAACKNIWAVGQAWAVLRHVRPDVVVGFGGYPSLPTMLAAFGCVRIIHEQNAVLGKANRLLATRVDNIITAFDGVSFAGVILGDASVGDTNKAKISPEKILKLGNPVRREILELGSREYQAPDDGNNDGAEINLLVTGGSQAANIFAEIIPQAIILLPKSLQQRLIITQQAKAEQVTKLQQQYANMGVKADIAVFFADIPAKLKAAHLVIARSGASTIAELNCAAVPAILVPLPSSADNHQYYNAKSVCDAGGGWLMEQSDFTAENMAELLQKLLMQPELLVQASIASCQLSTPDAAYDLAQHIIQNI